MNSCASVCSRPRDTVYIVFVKSRSWTVCSIGGPIPGALGSGIVFVRRQPWNFGRGGNLYKWPHMNVKLYPSGKIDLKLN